MGVVHAHHGTGLFLFDLFEEMSTPGPFSDLVASSMTLPLYLCSYDLGSVSIKMIAYGSLYSGSGDLL